MSGWDQDNSQERVTRETQGQRTMRREQTDAETTAKDENKSSERRGRGRGQTLRVITFLRVLCALLCVYLQAMHSPWLGCWWLREVEGETERLRRARRWN